MELSFVFWNEAASVMQLLSSGPCQGLNERVKPLVTRFANLDAIYGDPLLDRMSVLSNIRPHERLNWIVNAKAMLIKRRRELAESCSAENSYDDMLKTLNVSIIDVRISWLDRLYEQISEEARSARSDGGRTAPELNHN